MTRSAGGTSLPVTGGPRRPGRGVATAVACGGLGALGILTFAGVPQTPPAAGVRTAADRGSLGATGLAAAEHLVVEGPSGTSGTSGTPGSPGPSGPSGSSGAPTQAAPGAPANTASLASGIDPDLVDVNIASAYEGLKGGGTGIVLSSSGLVLTNNHVVEGATSITATDVGTHRTYRARVLGYDRGRDVALLQLEGASGLPVAPLGRSAWLGVGEGVVAVGNAGARGGTPSFAGGKITGLDRAITATDAADGASEHLAGLVETNADIVPGDSGGALVDTSGKVVAMDTAASNGLSFAGVGTEGFAIPIDPAHTLAAAIAARRRLPGLHLGATAFLGIGVQPSSGLAGGARIVQMLPGKPAARAGLSIGDLIVRLSGHEITSAASLQAVMATAHPGTSVRLAYLDVTGRRHVVKVHLVAGPAL